MMRGLPIVLLALLLLASCGYQFQKPQNSYDQNGPTAYMVERQDLTDDPARTRSAIRGNAARCTVDPDVASTMQTVDSTLSLPLSPGDLVHVSMPGLPPDEPPAGNYKIDSDGTIDFAGAGKLRVAGMSVTDVEAELARALVERGIYRPGHAHVTVRLMDRDAVRVFVAGAVFAPGQVVINERPQVADTTRETAFGDHSISRALSVALSHASGVRPDADIAHIVVERNGQRLTADLSGLIDGRRVNDILLIDGDRVYVPSRHCFQPALARATPITPPGIRVYLSNLTVPATSNASSAIGRDQTSLPYGTHLLQALFSANCVGGAKVTNADRSAVLVSANPDTGDSEVIERNIEALIRRPDRDSYNPLILPNDAIACYDSGVTNVRQILQSLGDLLGPVALARAVR